MLGTFIILLLNQFLYFMYLNEAERQAKEGEEPTMNGSKTTAIPETTSTEPHIVPFGK